MNTETLSLFFENNTIPEIKEKPQTFLGIAKQPHYENVWSNIYAFFFDVNGAHGLKDLFIKSLLKVINSKKDKPFHFSNNYNVQTEVSTNKSGRIDLLLSNDMDAIIIENKVYHLLNNDLEDYWQSTSSDNKQGIVLSLNAIKPIRHPDFINITHLELLTEIMNNFGGYMAGASDKFTIFLKDFNQNINNLSNSMEAKDLEFYFKYATEVNKAIELQKSITDYIQTEVEKGCVQVPDTIFYNSGRNKNQDYDYYLSKQSDNLMFTISYGDILLGKNTITIFIELQNDLLESNVSKLKELKLGTEESMLKCQDFKSTGHFAEKTFKVENGDFLNLSTFISNAITKSPLQSIFKKVEAFLF